MMRYLVHKCSVCSNIIRVTMTDGRITHIDGARQSTIWKMKRHTYVSTGLSNKTVFCSAITRHHMDGDSRCWNRTYISTFEEIKI